MLRSAPSRVQDPMQTAKLRLEALSLLLYVFLKKRRYIYSSINKQNINKMPRLLLNLVFLSKWGHWVQYCMYPYLKIMYERVVIHYCNKKIRNVYHHVRRCMSGGGTRNTDTDATYGCTTHFSITCRTCRMCTR